MPEHNTPPQRSITPLLLCSLIGLFILFLAWSARQAATGGTDVTDRDYYSKGLKYNSTLVEKRAASVIGWQLSGRLEGRTLILNLVDGRDKPIVSADGHITISGSRSNTLHALPLREAEPGGYRVDLPDRISGEKLVRIDFEREGARISRQLLLNIDAPAGH